jgi:hypothetical protein
VRENLCLITDICFLQLVACGVAVRTYNFGATDFKEMPVYKEAIESQGLFDEAPETSNSEIFENNPTEDAPLLSP